MPGLTGLSKIKSLLILFIIMSLFQLSAGAWRKPLPIVRLLKNWDAYFEMGKFCSVAFQKFGTYTESSACHTIIWDGELSSVVDYMNFCNKDVCSLKFLVKFERIGNTISENFTVALKSSYKAQCHSYLLLLSKTSDVTDLLRYGDAFRTLDTRGRFLIWYGDEDKSFESDGIWRKLPNVVFFHTKLNRRPSRNQKTSFKIISLKWPVMPNSTESTTKVIDFWRNSALAKNEDNWFPDKTSNLRNITLKVLTVEHPPSIIKYRSSNGSIEYAGSEIEVLSELSLIMNFNFDIIDADPSTKWGGVVTDTNGSTFTYGGVSRLINDEVDMALGSFVVLKRNLELLDMSIPLDVACTSFLTANPLPRPRYLALILPFQYTLWALVFLICLIFAPMFVFFVAKLSKPLNNIKEYRIFSTKWNSLITSISIISQVSLPLWPKLWAMRMLVGWYWIFCLLITLGWRCAMVSFLTIPLFEESIDNLKQLAASGLRVGGWGPELKYLFTQQIQSDDVDTDRARDQLAKLYELVENYDTGLNLVAERKFAMYENIRYLKFMLKTRNLTRVGTPTMRVMKQCILPVHIGIAYQKNSPIAPKINTHIRRFQESGLLRKWSQRLIAKTKQYYQKIELETSGGTEEEGDEEENEEDSEADQAEAVAAGGSKQRKERVLSKRDLQGAIYLIIFGTSMSILAFFVELFTIQAKRKKALLAKLPLTNLPKKQAALDMFTGISARVLKVKTDREFKAILREMGLLPSRKDELRWIVNRKWRMIKHCGRNDLFPYLE